MLQTPVPGFLKSGDGPRIEADFLSGDQHLNAALIEAQSAALNAEHGRAAVEVGLVPSANLGKAASIVRRAKNGLKRGLGGQRSARCGCRRHRGSGR